MLFPLLVLLVAEILQHHSRPRRCKRKVFLSEVRRARSKLHMHAHIAICITSHRCLCQDYERGSECDWSKGGQEAQHYRTADRPQGGACHGRIIPPKASGEKSTFQACDATCQKEHLKRTPLLWLDDGAVDLLHAGLRSKGKLVNHIIEANDDQKPVAKVEAGRRTITRIAKEGTCILHWHAVRRGRAVPVRAHA